MLEAERINIAWHQHLNLAEMSENEIFVEHPFSHFLILFFMPPSLPHPPSHRPLLITIVK